MMNECNDTIKEINQLSNPSDNISSNVSSKSNSIIYSDNIQSNGYSISNENIEILIEKNELKSEEKETKEYVEDIEENSISTCIENRDEIDDKQITCENQLLKENICPNCNNNEKITELESIILQQNKKLDEYEIKIQDSEQKQLQVRNVCADLENRLQTAIRHCEASKKEKEAMVMRYAVSEKSLLEYRAGRENIEKKLQDVFKEKDLLQHKLASMISEKARICQMLDNKCYELKAAQQELDRFKTDMTALETKLKWSQNSLRTEMELHKESNIKIETLTNQLLEATNEIEKTKREAHESIKNFHISQENRAHVLDQQLKEHQASLILEKHEREEKEHRISGLRSELDRLQSKHQLLIQENNALSLKVQQLERERLENEQKLSELRCCADKLRQDEANFNSLSASIEQLKLQLTHEQEQREGSSQQVELLKQRNSELETDIEACRIREADMLLFTQQLTDKNVRLQSEFSTLETKVQQLSCEQTLLKRSCKEHETSSRMASDQLAQERTLRLEEGQILARHLAEKTRLCEQLQQQLEDQRGENVVIRRKLELSVREITKELNQNRKRLEQYEKADRSTNSRSSSNSSLNVIDVPATSSSSPSPVPHRSPGIHAAEPDHQIIQPENALDRQVLIDHIVKLQRQSAKKSEKLDFLEEHVQTLVAELQRKSRLLQAYMVREPAGTLSSNRMDDNKAELAKLSGVMASMYGSRVQDSSLTLELSLDINRKLQAVLEDTLLKNITLKENVDTLGAEIDRLNKLTQSSCQLTV